MVKISISGIIRFYLLYYGDWEEGNLVIKPMLDYARPFHVGQIDVKNLTSFEGFANHLRYPYQKDWTYPISRFVQAEDLVPNAKGNIPLVQAVVDYFDAKLWMCSISINGGTVIHITVTLVVNNPSEAIYIIILHTVKHSVTCSYSQVLVKPIPSAITQLCHVGLGTQR